MADSAVAVVTDNLAFESSYQALERPPDAVSDYSPIPRGIRRFFISSAVSAKPVNDTIDLFVTATLPENFAYIITRLNVLLVVDTVLAWEGQITLRMSNHIPGQEVGTTETLCVGFSFQDLQSTGPFRALFENSGAFLQPFTSPMWATHGGSVTFRMHMGNIAAAVGAAGTIIAHAEFLEYDLNQAQRYWINTPMPTLAR